MVLLEVRDGGPALTNADLGGGLRAVYLLRAPPWVRQVGTGLRLAIVDGLTQRVGGKWKRATPLGEARFTAQLPAGGPVAG